LTEEGVGLFFAAGAGLRLHPTAKSVTKTRTMATRLVTSRV